ncbi:YdeI/OmpD-associated family protein [Pedobacter sp. MC2016-05]|uniref:YdeI/OmpD-associated family protein n=1 Tax=Pedobacter sp. MC2016-05 TaxID=2994474 RepID=UPI002245D4E7|nr:YdeI/OmpD-associated family protein [Pedobacter sp. MC2016-05]MCX2475661.1 YdeI/OmpD-associated family protein [Pedobacter sp. MC2016-05]
MHTIVQVDQYIINSAEFAIPILDHLRNLVHKADARIEEKMKWSMPFFELKGPVCHMASFKNHCAFGFWKGSLMTDELNLFKDRTNAMGALGKIKTFADLPPDEVLMAYIQQAIQLNEAGIKLPPKPKSAEKPPLILPQFLVDALQNDPVALRVFQNFSESNKREYVIWLEEAKTEATKQKRLETALEWLGEGKPRMWKYLKK